MRRQIVISGGAGGYFYDIFARLGGCGAKQFAVYGFVGVVDTATSSFRFGNGFVMLVALFLADYGRKHRPYVVFLLCGAQSYFERYFRP